MRAYSTNRPIGLGTWPSQHRDKVVEMVHFHSPTFIEDIHRTSFGYIEFSEDIPKEDLDAYEMVVPATEDATLQRIVELLWRYYDDDDKFQKVWGKAKAKGYSEDELGRAFDEGYEKYGK